MQGKQITAYVNAEMDIQHRTPLNPDKTVKSWASTQSEAESKAAEMRAKYSNAVVQIE